MYTINKPSRKSDQCKFPVGISQYNFYRDWQRLTNEPVSIIIVSHEQQPDSTGSTSCKTDLDSQEHN
jgi:hypothetical protein